MEFVIGLNDSYASFQLTSDWFDTTFSFEKFPHKTHQSSLFSIEFQNMLGEEPLWERSF